MLTMLRRNLTSSRKHHAQGSDVSLETKIKESNINLTSREKTTQAKLKQFMNFIFYKWGNYYFVSKVIVVSNIGKDAWDSVSAITRVNPLRSFTLKLYSMLCRRRGASARELLKIASKGLWLECTVMSPLLKSNWSNSLKAWTIVRVSFSINFMRISVLWARSRELKL